MGCNSTRRHEVLLPACQKQLYRGMQEKRVLGHLHAVSKSSQRYKYNADGCSIFSQGVLEKKSSCRKGQGARAYMREDQGGESHRSC